MKRLILISTVLLALVTMLSPSPAEANVSVRVGFSFFHDELAPYGEWVTISDYGEVWRPLHVAVGWQPYLNGRWCYTEYGWTWVAFDPWGGDPYHYGTWAFAADWGWVWVPGSIWAPAWVTWCDTGRYIGWAPVPPSVSISYAGYSGPVIVEPPRSYVFVPTRSFVGADVQAVRVDPAQNASFVSGGRTMTSFAVSGNVVRTGGPPVARIQKESGAPVRKVVLSVAKTHAVPIAKPAGAAKVLPVVMPRTERIIEKHSAETRAESKTQPGLRSHAHPQTKAEHPARPAEPPHETKAQAPLKRVEPPHPSVAQAPARKAEPPHETKAQAPKKRVEPPHPSVAQAPVRKAEPPHETKAQAPPKRVEPPHPSVAQAPARKAEPPHETAAQAQARKKPGNPGS